MRRCLRKMTHVGALAVALIFAACGPGSDSEDKAPSDDPADYLVDDSPNYRIEVSEPRWVVPSDGLPDVVTPQVANNNVDINFFEDRLFMAWRTAPTHFASDQVEMYVVSSLDGGTNWEFETRIDMKSDMREPRLIDADGRLQLMFFQAGTDMLNFEPVRIWRTFRRELGDWSAPEILLDEPEVPWDVKKRSGKIWMTSYQGKHYSPDPEAGIQVHFKQSTDGLNWRLVDDAPFVYAGGVSEVAFEFDADGSLWAVTRNEDGDESGWGSHVCTVAAGRLGDWDCPQQTDPERYDSPELFRHGDDLYLAARRDIGGPFGADGDMTAYSLRPKRSALYKIDKQTRKVVHLLDLPGCGDTAFPSVRRSGAHTFLLANYTSPLDEPDISWLQGQTSPAGTRIYLLTITFVPE